MTATINPQFEERMVKMISNNMSSMSFMLDLDTPVKLYSLKYMHNIVYYITYNSPSHMGVGVRLMSITKQEDDITVSSNFVFDSIQHFIPSIMSVLIDRLIAADILDCVSNLTNEILQKSGV